MFTRAQVQQAFQQYTVSQNIQFTEHWEIFQSILLTEIENSVTTKVLFDEAKKHGIKGAMKLRKHELIEKLWEHTAPKTTKRVAQQNKNSNNKKQKVNKGIEEFFEPNIPCENKELSLIEETVVETVQEVPVLPQDPNRCSVCQSHVSIYNCSSIYKYCEKKQQYSNDRIMNNVYDAFYRKWLPVGQRISNTHYELIESKRSKLRDFDLARAKATHTEGRAYMSYLKELQLYYPSLITDMQQDYLHGISTGNIVVHVDYDMVKLRTVN